MCTEIWRRLLELIIDVGRRLAVWRYVIGRLHVACTAGGALPEESLFVLAFALATEAASLENGSTWMRA